VLLYNTWHKTTSWTCRRWTGQQKCHGNMVYCIAL